MSMLYCFPLFKIALHSLNQQKHILNKEYGADPPPVTYMEEHGWSLFTREAGGLIVGSTGAASELKTRLRVKHAWMKHTGQATQLCHRCKWKKPKYCTNIKGLGGKNFGPLEDAVADLYFSPCSYFCLTKSVTFTKETGSDHKLPFCRRAQDRFAEWAPRRWPLILRGRFLSANIFTESVLKLLLPLETSCWSWRCCSVHHQTTWCGGNIVGGLSLSLQSYVLQTGLTDKLKY